jgi:isopentenyl-diphosphate delta-isomerase
MSLTTAQRKLDHLEICLNQGVETGNPGFNDVTLVHNCLPEVDLRKVDTSVELFGKRLNVPLIISAMTGGTKDAENINKELARIAEKKKIGFGLGSQRAMIEKKDLKRTYFVRGSAPNTLVLGNIGITEVMRLKPDKIEEAVKSVKADALCVHLNAAQEVFQKDGQTSFAGALDRLREFCRDFPYPVVAKEVGNGISRENAIALKSAGVRAIDVGGAGGTNWMLVDALRAGSDVGAFKHWGIPTAISVLECRTGLPVIATGGVRTGLDMAKAIALGASACGIALPFLRLLQKEGPKAVEHYIDGIESELRIAMFLAGAENVAKMKNAKYVLSGQVAKWCSQRK